LVYRLILPDWAAQEHPEYPRVLEGEFTEDQLVNLNSTRFYNVYYLPNYPSEYKKGVTVDGTHIDTFEYVFCDMDLKEGKYQSKDQFIEALADFPLQPTSIVDSGNGIHVYWRISDLDAMSFLRLQRRLIRKFNTDEAVAKIYQLMRVVGTANTKNPDDFKLCEELFYNPDNIYICEQMDAALPTIEPKDEEYCKNHYNKTYRLEERYKEIDEKLPLKFADLVRNNKEVKEIWAGGLDDRSKGDYRLGHIMFANGFTKEEATSVLINVPKALSRSPVHRLSYAEAIIEKIWTYEISGDRANSDLSESVKDILSKGDDVIKGIRFPCHKYLDGTENGFRLGQVVGLVAGAGVGKTAVALNMFMGFVKSNPDYVHFFVPLEQPAREVADRWRKLCGENTHLHEKVHILSNYGPDDTFRHLSLTDIRDYILKFQKERNVKAGCIVIDHIGVLRKESKNGENQGLIDICHSMKPFAVQTNTLLVMQSQAPREKAGVGDIELDKDAAYGTVFFESYCDYLITMWQPLKRVYNLDGCPKVTAFKFCKIRTKNADKDKIREDVPYLLKFDPNTEILQEMTQDDEKSFEYFSTQAVNIRKRDKRTDLVTYTRIDWTGDDGKPDSNPNT